MAPSGGGGAIAALFLGFVGFIVIVISIIFLSQKQSTSPVPAPETASAPAPAPEPASAPAPAPEPVPAPAPLTFGSITPRGPAPAPAPIIQQVFTAPAPPPYDTPLEKLLIFLTEIPDMLLTRQNAVMAIADLIINKEKSLVYDLVKGMFQRVVRLPELASKLSASIERRVAARTATGAIRGKFKFMSLLERARLGLSWGKTTSKLGENTSAKLVQEVGTRFNAAEALGRAAAQAGRATVSAGKLAGSLAAGIVTDPLMIAMATGMALDSKNVGNYAVLTQTSDMLNERNDQLKITAEATVDCTANPLGPKCPPSPGAAPAPGPAPPPKAGRFPRFLGPHDLMPVEAMFAGLETKIYSLVGDPSDPKGGFKTTIDMIPSSTYLDVKNSLTALYNSIDITKPDVDAGKVPFIYTSQGSQTIVQTAISTLKTKPKTTLLDVVINRLEIIFLMQGVVSDYIVQIRGNNYGDITLSDLQQLIMTPLSDAVLDKLIDAMLDFDCVENGGLVFNPGNGYDAHTCTWATKQDCHGAFPWALPNGTVIDDATQRTKDMMCTTTCPAPCPAGSPAPCGPPVPCPAPSPCAAISDPSKVDLTYTEWRSKDWFSKANWISSTPAWNAALDQNAIPSGGACIAGDAGFHSFCDDSVTTGSNTLNVGGTANNVYIRDTGTCVNSEKMCAIKGVSYDWNMAASKLGPGNVEGSNYPSCYRSESQKVAEDLFGATITRFATQGGIQPGVINSGNSTIDQVVSATVNMAFVMPIVAIVEAPQTAQALSALFTGGEYCPGNPGGACRGDALCTASTTYRNAGRTKFFDVGGDKYNCCKPTQIVNERGDCREVCRADQTRDVAGGCTCLGTSKPIDFGDRCGTTAECPACTGGKVQKGISGCLCECPSNKYDDNGTCRDLGTCPVGKMYTGSTYVNNPNQCVTACSGATPVWDPDTQKCVAAASCPPSKPVNAPPPTSGTITGVNVCTASGACPVNSYEDATTKSCVATCPSGTLPDAISKKCISALTSSCPSGSPWYNIPWASCTDGTLFPTHQKYQSTGGLKLQVCPTGQNITGTLGAFGVCAAATPDQMTQTIAKYGWNVLGTGNDTASSAYCSANNGVLYSPGTCSSCGPGAYFDTTTLQCTNCPPNTYKSGNGWKKTDCAACPSGTYTQTWNGRTSASDCVNIPACPAGYARNPDGITCSVTSCPAGKQPNSIGGYCDSCPVGTYKTDTSLNSCTPCTSGLTTAAIGSTAASACVTPASLDTGSYTVYDNSWVGSGSFVDYNALSTKINGVTTATTTLAGCQTSCQTSTACGGFTRLKSLADTGTGLCSFWTVDGAKNRRVANQFNKVYVKN